MYFKFLIVEVCWLTLCKCV